MADLDRCGIAETFFPCPHACTVIGASSGFSGSMLARVEAMGGTWCLRRWPPGTDPTGLAFVHAALGHSRARGFRGVPRLAATATGATAVLWNGAWFDAQEWVAGIPLATSADGGPAPNPVYRLQPGRLRALSIGLAEFHRSTGDFLPPPTARRSPLAERLVEAGRELGHQRIAIEAWLRAEPDGGLRELAREWLSLLPGAVARAAELPAAATAPPDSACAVVHGDLWAPHVFFGGEAFTGFVDVEGLSWDTPAIDLAQVVLHFNGWEERAVVLAAYAGLRPLTAGDEALLPAAAMLDLAGEGVWSLGTLAAAHGQPAHRDRHVTNLQTLLASLHGLSASHRHPRFP
jgi:Ser/Thr protein kinase RdoA (MazF antagonist)